MFHAEKPDIPLVNSRFKIMQKIVHYRANHIKH